MSFAIQKGRVKVKRILIMVAISIVFLNPFTPTGALAEGSDWKSISGLTGGSMAALAMSPGYSTDLTVFAGLRGHGVYRSTDGGSTWQPSGLSDQVIVDLVLSPNFTTDHTLFAATGLGSSGYVVYRSTDGGATWQPPYAMPYGSGFKPLISLSISPNYGNDHTLYALGTTEMYKSTDGGLVYSRMTGWYATHHVTELEFSPAFATDHTMFAAVEGGGIVKSVNSGGTWLATSFDVNFTFTALAVSPNYPNDLTVAAIDSFDGQLLISTDGGASRRGYSLHLGSGDKHTLLFSPMFATDHLMLAASSGDPGAYRSIDSGETWTPVGWPDPANPYHDHFVGGSIRALAVPPNTGANYYVLAGTASGLYLSQDRGQNWSQNNVGLPYLTMQTIAIAPNNPDRLLAGTSYFDHQHANSSSPVEADGSVQLSQDGGKSWRDVSGEIDRVRRVIFSPNAANDHTAFACAGTVGQNGYAGGGVYRSIDDARLWSTLIAHAACYDLALSPSYAIDHTAWAYVVGQGVLRTTNSGDSWSAINNSFVAERLLASPNYVADHTLFASTPDARLLKSSDDGAHWTPVLNNTITAVAISPAYGAGQTIYAGVKETSNSPGAIYRSGDGGAHWQKLSTGIPASVNNQSATISAIDFAKDGSILAGVIYGSAGSSVYRSVDGGGTWQAWGNPSDNGLFNLISLTNAGESDEHGAFTFIAATAHATHWRDQQQRDPAEPGAWDTLGPRGGRADVLALSPNFAADGAAFAGEWNWFRYYTQYGRGLAKSTDWGQSWQASNDPQGLPNSGTAVNGVAFSPGFASDHTVFLASYSGLFKSTDGGAHWQQFGGFEPNIFHAFTGISVAPNYPASGHMLAVGDDYGHCLYRSTDFGVHWTYGCSVTAQSVAYSPNFAQDNTIFIAGNGVRRSADGGLSWTPILTASVGAVVAPHYGVDHTLFASGDALYTSNNDGATWISVTVGLSPTILGTPAVSPAYAADHTLWVAAGNQLYRSVDGGLHLNLVPGTPNLALGPLVISPGWPAHHYMFIGTAQGVYRSSDGGASWSRMSGLLPLAASALTLSADDALWLTGTTNGIHASTDHGHTWFPFSFQDYAGSETGMALSPDYASDHTLFAVLPCNGCLGGSIYRTKNGGTTWNRVFGGGQSLGALAISPHFTADHTVFAGNYDYRVVGSTDGGDSWQSIGTWPPGTLSPKMLVALPPNYPTDSTVFAANYGFWRLPPGETVWQPAASGIVSSTHVSALAVAPNYTTSHTLLATIYDYTMEGLHSAVLRSDDGGVNWQPSDSGLATAEWRSLAFSPHYADDHTVYLASTQQLYRSVDDGYSWIAVGATPDGVSLDKVAVSNAGEVIVTTSAGVSQYRTGFRDVLVNGEAEALSGWALSADGAAYASEINFHAQQSLRLGLAQGSNHPIDSFAAQTVTIPVSATLAQLNLRLYPASSEANAAAQNLSSASGDAQYVTITPSGTGAISSTVLWMLSNAQTWQRYSFDLRLFAGQTVVVRVGAINDGQGGQTALYVDSASLITLGSNGHRALLPVILK
jgi:photosystem II stability/assembly factor-like uncharacterized protein